MSEIKREDLRVRYGPTKAPVRINRDGQYEIDVPPQGHRLASDADLAALGYVRLDVEEAIVRATEALWDGGMGAYPIDVVNGLARMAVLAALDGEADRG